MAKKKELRKEYGLTKKDVERYRKWCGGDIPKKWSNFPDRWNEQRETNDAGLRDRERVISVFTKMPYEHKAILLGFSELSPDPKSGTVVSVSKDALEQQRAS